MHVPTATLPSPFFGSHISFFLLQFLAFWGLQLHTHYILKSGAGWQNTAEWDNVIILFVSLPRCSILHWLLGSRRLTLWGSPNGRCLFFTSNKLNFGQPEAICSWYEIYYFLLFVTKDKHRHIAFGVRSKFDYWCLTDFH